MYKNLIREKREVFNDFCIEWNPVIERKFIAEMQIHPERDPRCVLDFYAHDYLVKGIEEYHTKLEAKNKALSEKFHKNFDYIFAKILKKYSLNIIPESVFITNFGKRKFKEMLECGVVTQNKYGMCSIH